MSFSIFWFLCFCLSVIVSCPAEKELWLLKNLRWGMVGHSDWGKWTFLRKTNCAMVAKRENWRFLVARRSLVDKSEGNHDDRLRCILWGRSGGNIGKHQFIYLDNSLFSIKLTGKRGKTIKLQTMQNTFLGSGFLEQKDNRRKRWISFWQEDICNVEEKKGEENIFLLRK